MKLIRLAVAAAFVLGTGAAQAQTLPDRIKQAGKIVFATNPNYAPIIYKDPKSNQLTGLDYDLGEAIAKELGVKAEWSETAFAQMLPSLQTGRVDAIMAFMADRADRREVADFVGYMRSGAQFYTVKQLADKIKKPDDLCGKKVGTSRSTAWPKQIADWSQENCVAKGKPAIEVVGTEGSVDARTQLRTLRLDAAVQGVEAIVYEQSLDPGLYVLVGEPFTLVTAGVGIGKKDTQLRDAVQAALESLRKKGIYQQIVRKYGLEPYAAPEFGINKGT